MLFELFYSPQKHIEVLEKEIQDLLSLKSKTSFSGDSVATYIATPASLDSKINIRKELIQNLQNYYRL